MSTQKNSIPVYSLAFTLLALALSACGPSASPTASNKSTPTSVQMRADAGDAAAQFELGMSLREGQTPDNKAAFTWLLKAAEGGNAEAMFEVSRSYDNGIGTGRDKELASKWLKRAAGLEHGEALGRLALSYGYYKGGSIHVVGESSEERESNGKIMFDLLQRGVAKGDLRASELLGACYLFGVNEGKTVVVQQDHAKAIALLKAGAEKDRPIAMWMLAVLFQYGFGSTPADVKQAEIWWDKVEKITTARFQRYIGYLYLVEDRKTYVSGKNKWRNKRLSFEESNAIGVEWLEKAANQKDVAAMRQLAAIYRAGNAVNKDFAKAFGYELRAAEQGDSGAQLAVVRNYFQGTGVAKSYGDAIQWAERAVNNPSASRSQVAFSQLAIGDAYYRGTGVNENPVVAYAWLNLAVAGGLNAEFQKTSETIHQELEGKLSREQLAEAQRLSVNWKQGEPMGDATTANSKPDMESRPNRDVANLVLKKTMSGSAIVVTSGGKLLTNQHVVTDCKEIRLPAFNHTAALLLGDKANDLALLQLDGGLASTGLIPAVIADENSVKQGEDIVAFGFPLDGYLPAAGNITQGIVSSLSGPFNNSSMIQITAPIQQGNSGGPVMNLKGQVVGVVVGKADAIKVAKITGDIPQNINFAISVRAAKGLLEGNGVSYETPGFLAMSKSSTDLAELAKKTTVKIECWQ